MATTQPAAFIFKFGKLERTNHINQQTFAEDIARNLVGTQQEPPKAEDGQAGKDGTLVNITRTEFAVEDESAFLDTGIALTGANVQLINFGPSTEIPTVGISAIKGTVVFFTSLIDSANYKVSVAVTTLTNPV